MAEQAASSREDFRAVLRKQRERVVAALTEEAEIDATPVIRDDEDLSCEEYVTLVYELHHVDLPELAAAGIVEFDRREETVRRGAHFRRSSSVTRPR